MSRADELRAIDEAIAAGRCHRITAEEAAAYDEAAEAAAAARRQSVSMFFIPRSPERKRG
jgi:hypothetical protein